MEYKELEQLLDKHKKQTCTPDEIQRLNEYLADSRYEDVIKEILHRDIKDFKVAKQEIKAADFKKIYQSIESKIADNENNYGWNKKIRLAPTRNFSYLLKIAAILIFFFSAGSIITYFLLIKSERQAITYNEINVPFGARSQVSLPDGSTVWLNAGSKIRYQNFFNNQSRQVYLEGEAYFKIAKNSALPFTVKTDELNIVALGTEFNVKAYNDEKIIETTLVEGAVSIVNKPNTNAGNKQEVYLKPCQKAVYIKSKQQMEIEEIQDIAVTNPEIIHPEEGSLYIASKVDTNPIIAWKYDKLIFRGEELYTIAIKLERKYNISISFDTEDIKHFKFTGKLEDETITQVLDVIKLTAPIDYVLEGKQVNIYENSKMKQKFMQHLREIQNN
jgi:ferric-dicitrate binding protein FerR (iron transport regulator)